MTNKIQQVCYTVLELEVARLQTVVIFQLQLLITRLLIRKCLFQLKTSLEQFVFDNRQTSRRNQIFFFSSSTIQIYFLKHFQMISVNLLLLAPGILRFYKSYIIANRLDLVILFPHFNN